MDTEIGAFEAKTRFSEILRKVQEGEHFIVTLRGKPVAEVVPTRHDSPRTMAKFLRVERTAEERADALQRLRNPRIAEISGDTVLEWIREGRK